MEIKTPGSPDALAKRIEHTLLKIDERTAKDDLLLAVRETADFGFRALVVHPNLVSTVARNFPHVRVVSVVSYPLGCDSLDVKIAAVHRAADDGAAEVDAVLDLFAMRAANFRKIAVEAKELVKAAHGRKIIVKLIMETPILDEEFIRAAARALAPAGADFWKTSTGYGRRPVALSAVRLLREIAPKEVHIKASGGIKTYGEAMMAFETGAFVIGTSSGPAILEEALKSMNGEPETGGADSPGDAVEFTGGGPDMEMAEPDEHY